MFFLQLFIIFSIFSINTLANNYDITVKGNKTIEGSTIKIYSNLDGKTNITRQDISNAVKNIYKTGFFNNVSILQEEERIIINVQETPIVKKIAFNGSKAIGKDKILEELTTKEKRFFSKTDIQNDTKRLTLIYQKLGFLNVKIRPMAQLEDGGSQVIVIFDIKEGGKAQINTIKIEGNKHFSDGIIKDEALKIEERTIFKLNLGASFDAERIQNEAENIKRFYMQRGFPKFVHKNIVSEYNAERNLFDVRYFIEEGERYKFGEHEIKTFVEGFDVKTIKNKMIASKKNTIFNIDHVEKTVANIQEVLQAKGFMFSKVDYEFEFTEDKKVNIKYIIRNSKRIYLHQIIIIGNVKTSDNVIRREFLLKEGDVYNVAKLRRSIQRLNNLQYFEDIQVDEKLLDGTADRMVLTIKVKERSTASVSASIGFDQINGLGGNLGLQQSNFLGEGYSAGISAERTFVSEGYNFSFSNPYFKGRNILLGTNLSHSRYGNPRFVAYNSNTDAISFTGAYSVTEYLRHSVIYRYQIDNIESNSSSLTSPFILAQIGNYQTSAIANTLMYDRRDNNFIPTEGYSAMFRNEIAGLGGNVKFISNEIKADYYQKLFNIDELVFASKLRIASIMNIGNSFVNIQNLYALGGGFGMRGFNYRGIGPRLAILDANGNVSRFESFSYGGKNLEVLSFELRFPNKLPKDIGLITYWFVDIGRLYGIDGYNLNTANTKMFDSRMFRASTGLGVSWRSPMGPIGFAFGRAIRQETYDTPLFFLITFGGMGQF